ncbi:MAG: 2-C-methyl-D-erythritol 4-phosphate cytidylyltransferase [Planctomycetes bacterium]|nr:2-C-methyl-D-erythritol 4-phosphate cytidylyltransferase [Planctomycetota bacterium]
MAQFSCIIVAGGSGSRMQADRKKAFIELADEPLVLHTARAFKSVSGIAEMVVVLPADELKQLTASDSANVDTSKLPQEAERLAFQLQEAGVTHLVVGGARRQDSVLNGLWATSPDSDYVMVHDAARPFVTSDELQSLMQRTVETGAAILAHPVRDTLKAVAVDKGIEKTVSRNGLWAAQTPQAFGRQALLDAFKHHNSANVTDDAEMFALAGGRCSVVQGSAQNFKITTPEDLQMAEALIVMRSVRDGDIRPASAIFRRIPGGDTIFDVEPPKS